MMEPWPWGGFAVYEPLDLDSWRFMFRKETQEECINHLKQIRPNAFKKG